MSWQDDPIVQPATQSASSWQNDPVVKPATSQTPSFGSNRGVENPTTNAPSAEAAMNASATALTSVPAAILNAGKTVGELETGKGDTGDLDKEVTDLNTTREGWMKDNPAAKGLDIAGQAAIPVAGSEGMVGKAMSYAPKWLTTGLQGFAARAGIRSGIGAGQGATVAAEQPHDNQSPAQIEQSLGQGAKTGAELNAGIGVAADSIPPVAKFIKHNFSDSDKNVNNRATSELNQVTSDSALAAGNNYIATPKAQRPLNLSTAEATATPNEKGQLTVSPGLAASQKDVQSGDMVDNKGFAQTAGNGESQVSPERIFNTQNTKNKDTVATELQNLQGGHEGIVANAPNSVEASKTLTNEQKLAEERSRLAYNEKYNSIDKEEQIDGPIHPQTVVNFDMLREGKTNNMSNHEVIHGGEDSSEDSVLKNADDTFSQEGNSVPVGAQIRMKNELRAHADDMFNQAENLNPGSAEQKLAFARGKLASQMAENVVDNLKRMTNVTTKSGDTVSDAVVQAENMRKEHAQNFMENPDTFSGITTKATNAPMTNLPQGATVNNGVVEQQYGKSRSDTAKLFGKAYNKSEEGAAVSGSNLIDSSSPEKFDSQVKSFKATPNADQLISNKILGDIKSEGGDIKAFNKYFGPQQKQSLEESGFRQAAETLSQAHGQALYDDIKSQAISKDAKSGFSSIDTQKFSDLLDEHEQQLRETFGDAHYNRLKEIAQTSSVLDQVAGIPAKPVAVFKSKEGMAGLKGITQKIFQLSYSALNAVTAGLGDNVAQKVRAAKAAMLNDPDAAIPAIEAFRNGEKDPQGVVSAITSLAAKSAPSAAAAVPAHNDGTLDKEIKANTKPSQATTTPDKRADNDEKGFLSQFSPISDANASELPKQSAGTQKKSEFQIADASQATGMPKEYFHAVEKAETQGSTDPNKARPIDKVTGKPKSSAYGLGQFTEATWNEMAEKHNLPPVTDKNRYTNSDPRSNSDYSRLAIGYYGSANADKLRPFLQSKFNRDTTVGDVYGAHLMGLNGFKQFISANPNTPANSIVPAAAKNNKSLFFDDNGKALSVRQVYKNMESRLGAKDQPAATKSDIGSTEDDMEPFNK